MNTATRNNYFRPFIKEGSTGEDVKDLQKVLNATVAEPKLLVDGVFGAKTKQAVIAYQKKNSLSADGIIGPITWVYIDYAATYQKSINDLSTLKLGSRSADVTYLQYELSRYFLNDIGSIVINGIFGEETKNTVIDFQKQYNLTVDGIVGNQTWAKLKSIIV